MAIDRTHLSGRGFTAEILIVRDGTGIARDVVLNRVGLDLGTKTLDIRRNAYGTPVVRSEEHRDVRDLRDLRGAPSDRPRIPDRDPFARGMPAHRVRGQGTGIVRFDVLGQVQRALAQTLAANHALVTGADHADRRNTAEDVASAVLQTLGLELPPVVWIPGSTDAHAIGGQIRMGEELARTLTLPALTQILLHEAGHVHEGHSDVATNLLLHALREEGYLSAAHYGHLMRNDERVADLYAALGAWMFDPAQRPAISDWLLGLDHPESGTHPASAERAANIAALVNALDRAAEAGAFQGAFAAYNGDASLWRAGDRDPPPWAFGDPIAPGSDADGGDGGGD